MLPRSRCHDAHGCHSNQTNFSFATPGFGAVVLRTRVAGGVWRDVSAFGKRSSATPLQPLPSGQWAAASESVGSQLTVERHWAPSREAGGVRLWYTLRNNGSAALELGGFAVSMPANEQVRGTWCAIKIAHTEGGGSCDCLARHCPLRILCAGMCVCVCVCMCTCVRVYAWGRSQQHALGRVVDAWMRGAMRCTCSRPPQSASLMPHGMVACNVHCRLAGIWKSSRRRPRSQTRTWAATTAT